MIKGKQKKSEFKDTNIYNFILVENVFTKTKLIQVAISSTRSHKHLIREI